MSCYEEFMSTRQILWYFRGLTQFNVSGYASEQFSMGQKSSRCIRQLVTDDGGRCFGMNLRWLELADLFYENPICKEHLLVQQQPTQIPTCHRWPVISLCYIRVLLGSQ